MAETSCPKCSNGVFALEERNGCIAVVCANHKCGETKHLIPPKDENAIIFTGDLGEG